MMMKVALLLLALAAPMISALGCSKARSIITDSKKCSACKQVKLLINEVTDENGGCRIPKPCDCPALGLVKDGKNSGLLEHCCHLDCHDAKKIVKRKANNKHRCISCDWATEIQNAVCTKKKHDKGYGGYGGGGHGDYDGCLYGYGCDSQGNSYCTQYGGYGIGDVYANRESCKNYESAYDYNLDQYTAYDNTNQILYGYGKQYGEGDKCKDQKPALYVEYVYALGRCGEDYAPPPVYEPKECPKNKCTYDEQACAKYNTCTPCPTIDYADYDAALSSSGETTNETVQTLSWVLIAIAAALFLASIAFCAVGRRERKAHAAENVHVNALA